MFKKLFALFFPDSDGYAFASSTPGIITEYMILALTGAAFTFAFPAFKLAHLCWFALIPLCMLTAGHSFKGAFLRGFVWGYFWSVTSFFWIREIVFFIPFVLAAVLAVFPALWAGFTAFLWRNLAHGVDTRLKGFDAVSEERPFAKNLPALNFMFSSAACWCVLEWVRGWILTGLPWNYLGATQWENTGLIQICEYTGVFGVSFVIAVLNIGFVLAIHTLRFSAKIRRYTRPLPLMTAVVLVLATSFAGWKILLSHYREMKDVFLYQVGVIQPDLSQRRNANSDQSNEAIDVCIKLSSEMLRKSEALRDSSIDSALMSGTEKTPVTALSLKNISGVRLVVWPETAVPNAYLGNSFFSEKYRLELGRLIDRYNVPFLVGSIDFESDPEDPSKYDVYNGALLLTESGGKIADKYYKVHRVPFGEFVPFGDTFPVLNKIVGMGRNLSAGKRFNPIETAPGVRIGVSVCFESVFPYVSNGHARNGATMLLVIANDAWYPTSFEPDQHFSNAVFRAVETRLPLLRSGNSSHTALITPNGKIADAIYTKPSRDGEIPAPEVKGRASAKFMVPVPRNHKPTFYTLHGDVFVGFCGLLMLLGFIPAALNWRAFRSSQYGE